MKRTLLYLLLLTYLSVLQAVKGQNLAPVYEIDTLTEFEKLGSEFQTIIYDGAIWKRRDGLVPANNQTNFYIPAAGDSYYERQQTGRNARTTSGVTVAMLSDPNKTFVITDTLDLNGQTIQIHKTSNISFQGGVLINGTIVNNFISIKNLNGVLAERNFKLDSAYVYISNTTTINVDCHDTGSFTIESNGLALIKLVKLAFYAANVTIRNCNIIKDENAFKFLNQDSTQIRKDVLIENCVITQQKPGTNDDDSWAIVIGTQPANKAAIEEQRNIRFTCRNTTFTNIGLAVYEAACNISRCSFKAGNNNMGNKELLHFGGGSTRLMSSVRDCLFDGNNIDGDLIDTYNSSNRVFESCRFIGANGASYITIKSLVNRAPPQPNTGIDSDQIGAQSNIVISSCLFEGKVDRNFGAIAIYNSDRNGDSLVVLDSLKRYNVKVDKCTFKLFDNTTTDYNVAVTVGNTEFVWITNNTVVIPKGERSVMVNCIYQPSTNIIISGNMLKNESPKSKDSSKLIGKTLNDGRLKNSVIDNNIVQIGYILNDKVAWEGLTITNNSASVNIINTGSDTEMINCYRSGNKANGIFTDNQGTSRPDPKSVPVGFSYFHTGLGKTLWVKNATTWVDASGTVVQ